MKKHVGYSTLCRRTTLAAAVLAGLATAPAAFAQSTTGNISGTVPAGANQTIVVEGSTGVRREVQPDPRGKYSASNLPLGSYTVTLLRDGTAVDTRKNVGLRVGQSTDVSFDAATANAGDATSLSGVTVTSNTLPNIDVTTVDSRTVITSEQLAKLPLGRNAEAIAKLAPGVVANSGGFTSATAKPTVSFGGSSVTENAYYINGFNTTDPLNGMGGLQLPYGAIDQQEVYTGGYSAQYGRSDGGVISQVGKRGTNEWHFGAQILWEPSFARAKYPDLHYTSTPATQVAGNLYWPKSENTRSTTTVSAYAGGPLIKDKLFLFVAGEYERNEQHNVNTVDNTGTPASTNRFNSPRWYGKLDWNITDNHIIEVTGASDKREGTGTRYYYDFNDRKRLGTIGPVDNTKTGGDLHVFKYTGYITDALTISALYGEMKTSDYDSPGAYDPNLTRVANVTSQNPALNGGTPIGNTQIGSLADPDRGNKQRNFRLDISYQLGDHTILAGIDNMKSQAIDNGTRDPGPGYVWNYGHTNNPNAPISTAAGDQFVPAPALYPNGATGYYVSRNVSNNLVTVRSDQRAQYIEDKWQVTDRWLLSLGLRNDQFTDYNPFGEEFITQTKPQWAPRIGASWDVLGDGSFKVFGNAGRYYLGLPLNPATGAASGYVSTQTYFTYGGIDANGVPTGLTQISGPVSANNSYGVPPDPRTVTARNLKPEHQDEFILGFDKTLGENWVYGAKATRRLLRTAIDDYCEIDRVTDKAAALGYTPDPSKTNSCYLINAGASNTFTLLDAQGNQLLVPLSREEMGFQALKRKYYGLELFMEHSFDGVWYAKFDYVFSRSYGNTEGQVRSDLRQGGASASEDWDNAAIMVNTNGVQNNDHTHVFKAYGYWQVAPEWQISSNVNVTSGGPELCLGYFGPDHTNPTGYGNAYHWCDGEPSPPGSHGRLPWTFTLDLGVTWRPAFAADKLAFSANVFNVLNQQRATFRNPNKEGDAPNTPNPQYRIPLYTTDPRYARVAVTYDF
ncbi:TonB-dependent receptor [Luteibacter yeojuensis]|uniref:Oar protein n=1 Tax=Luteibacter yeojuensis TaxID=345309 RepID=A0A0F3KJ93_9GAMM|nr:TonB-dependent receptor [Luteibacter yeojuensis]KJV31335.1 Oar protein [Luteibacter yeojuensis]